MNNSRKVPEVLFELFDKKENALPIRAIFFKDFKDLNAMLMFAISKFNT